ncbi:hypothetical protein [Phycicoccus sonneratiae]|uniref:Uncharacterized protein n=1 Tax=Phycicoccus sonneratiae TaxID=2807628 RepID=A0ABS2CN67_9MICO|nr:hypothetical protein [Phycicoccus sonneraticus]MBM6400616.1 hypothetical protein [Phycicoccus sonneraticus]
MTGSAHRLSARWLPGVVAVLAVVGLGGLLGAPAAGADDPVGRVVLVGAPGLAWSDVDATTTPTIERLAAEGAVASMTVRGVRSRSCGVDGWLTLSAGRRAGDDRACAPAGPVTDGTVTDWSRYVAASRAASYGAVPGTLGTRLAAAGECVEAVGAGAAVGAADSGGRVEQYAPSVPATFTCPVVLVEGGSLPVEGPGRTAALGALDDLVAEVVRAAGSGARVVVAGVGDGDSSVRPRAVVVSGAEGVLTSPSTRQPGLVQLQDLTASLLAWAGADDAGLTGRPVVVEADSAPVAERVADRVGFEARSATLRSVSPQVTGWLAVAFALWCVAVGVAWWRRPRVRVPTALAAAGVGVASVPTATFVSNLVPWWHAGVPAAAFVGVLVAVVLLTTAAALVAGRRWRHGALAVVAVLTLLVLGGDVLTGSGLQLASVFGQNPTVGGRFYGVGNTSYALYGVSVLAVAALLAAWRRPGRRWAVLLAALVLVVAAVLEGHPSYGADFGGPPGLLLGGLVVLASAAGLRLTVTRVVVAVGAVALVTVGVAVLDWLRPAAARTHLGEFVQTVLDGGADDVLGRKLAQNLTNLGSPPLLAIAVGAAVLAVLAWRLGRRPDAVGGRVLRGSAVLALAGFLVNDSGLVIPAFAALLLVPLLVAAGPGSPDRQARRE